MNTILRSLKGMRQQLVNKKSKSSGNLEILILMIYFLEDETGMFSWLAGCKARAANSARKARHRGTASNSDKFRAGRLIDWSLGFVTFSVTITCICCASKAASLAGIKREA